MLLVRRRALLPNTSSITAPTLVSCVINAVIMVTAVAGILQSRLLRYKPPLTCVLALVKTNLFTANRYHPSFGTECSTADPTTFLTNTVLDAAEANDVTSQQASLGTTSSHSLLHYKNHQQQNLPSLVPTEIEKWLDMSLEEGRCVGVHATNGDSCFPPLIENAENDNKNNNDDNVAATMVLLPSKFEWMNNVFHKDEICYGLKNLKQSRTSFWLGRLALRWALDFPEYAILKDPYGRPQLSQSSHTAGKEGKTTTMVYGSVSHKQDRGVALASLSQQYNEAHLVLAGVGVDLEMTSRPEGKPSIAKRVLTLREQQALGNLPRISPDEEVLLRFSLKEAIYKAAHPVLCQYVGFQEAEVTPLPDGTAVCRWIFSKNHPLETSKIAKLTAHWQRLTTSGIGGDFFLTSASVYTTREGSLLGDTSN